MILNVEMKLFNIYIHLRGVWARLLLQFSDHQPADIYLFLQLQSLFNLNDKRKPCVFSVSVLYQDSGSF